jgi:DNA-binding GntR family transcriptional regulator
MELAAEVGIRQFGTLGFSVDSHRQLVDAIASHDVERARDVLAEMVARNREAVLGLYALGPPAAGDGA